jgi:DNA-binding response OmpR family regulator
VFAKAELKRALWGRDAARRDDRTLASHAGHLRQRLHAAGAELAHSSYGIGYSLTTP